MKLVPDDETGEWLLFFWHARHLVRDLDQDRCPTPLAHRDVSTERCVLARWHLDVDRVPVDVPHVTADGHLALLIVHRSTILEVRHVQKMRDAGLTG